MWQSSLLQDLTWTVRHPNQGVRCPIGVPTWSWASTAGAVEFGHIDLFCWAKNLDVTYTHVGHQQLGKVVNAAILLECRSCMGFISWDDKNRNETYFIPDDDRQYLPQLEVAWLIAGDYDLSAGIRPVKKGERIVVAFIEWVHVLPWTNCSWCGLALREISRSEYERIGMCTFELCDVESPVRRKAKVRDNIEWRLERQFFSSLPIRKFKIV